MILKRILEPEVMDTVDEAIAYDSMDHAEVNRRFATDFLLDFNGTVADSRSGEDNDQPLTEILDLGTGTALIPIELCRQSPTIRIVAVDLAISMLDLARNNIEVAGMTDRIMLDRIDAKEIHYDDSRFAAVISNSIVHHVPDPQFVIKEAVRVTTEGGRLFFRDLMRPANQAALDKLVETYTGQEDQHSQQMFRDSLHAALTVEEVRSLVGQLGFEESTVQATSDRHWTWNATKGS